MGMDAYLMAGNRSGIIACQVKIGVVGQIHRRIGVGLRAIIQNQRVILR